MLFHCIFVPVSGGFATVRNLRFRHPKDGHLCEVGVLHEVVETAFRTACGFLFVLGVTVIPRTGPALTRSFCATLLQAFAIKLG